MKQCQKFVAMKQSIHEQSAKEMKGMSSKKRLIDLRRQVQQGLFAGKIRRQAMIEYVPAASGLLVRH